ncbi:DcuS/MalK family sensor histidine kinase [Chryseomicrobium aureum]|uniref:DcuS/MalK family sensor histidine kinase n=1 Tax=Chryseomicrobium aureum TaxID=1441723 RepID=UPI00370D7932
MRRPKWKLTTVISLFVIAVVAVSLLVTDILISVQTSQDTQEELEEKARIISRTVAESSIVQDELLTDEIEGTIQEYTSSIQQASDVLFIVVMDMTGLRQSHPNPEQIGNRFVGGDEQRVLAGEEYISISEGTLGYSVRAFAPIYKDGVQIGAVSTGISLDAVDAAIFENHQMILLGSAVGILAGIIGAILLARYIKKSLLGLEPVEIARIYQERDRMFQTVREGIVAIDEHGIITYVNRSARDIFEKAGIRSDNPVGLLISSYLPHSRLELVLETGRAEYDEQQELNGTTIIVNRIPIEVNGKVVGAISTFRDKTEVNRLAEQLTGVRLYADSLRAQSHEFRNQLQVLLGLAEIGDTEHMKRYITQLAAHQIEETDRITEQIHDPILSGFLLGKISFAREQGAELAVFCETDIPVLPDGTMAHDLVTIVGNLVDNALEAAMETPPGNVTVDLSCVDDLLTLTVEDDGPGMASDEIDLFFEKGQSSKGETRGYGLYLVKTSVESLHGSLEVDSVVGNGTTIQVIIPIEGREET